MIDAKRLEEGERIALRELENMGVATGVGAAMIEQRRREIRETYRLMRLGLWAEKHGAPLVRQGLEYAQSDFCSHLSGKECGHCKPFEDALAALPKGEG
jgi:hypothetical protein